MNSNKAMYWWSQIVGWLIYYFIIILYNFFGGNFSLKMLLSGFLIFSVGVSTSHLFRYIIVKQKWLKLNIFRVIPRIIITAIAMGTLFYFLHGLLSILLIPNSESFFQQGTVFTFQMIMNWIFLLLFWAMIYFTSNYFINFKNQEIKNLRLEANNRDIMLTQLKSQLNPHFTFNALNSIRALIDENPPMAKNAVTQLSRLLRGALNTDIKKTISINDEIAFVENYLELEKIRFEDRLNYTLNIDNDTKTLAVPPLLVQTLVENAVKHGIGSLTEGGEIILNTKVENSFLLIVIRNSGEYQFSRKKKSGGLGLLNTRRRLSLLYGTRASLKISNDQGMVKTVVTIPLNP